MCTVQATWSHVHSREDQEASLPLPCNTHPASHHPRPTAHLETSHTTSLYRPHTTTSNEVGCLGIADPVINGLASVVLKPTPHVARKERKLAYLYTPRI